MKNIHALITAALSAVLLTTGCSTVEYYQVYEVQAPQLKQENQSYVSENQSVKVTYDFWENKGAVKFTVQNKTDKNIYLYYPECFYVENGYSRDYYDGKEYTSSRGLAIGKSKANSVAFTGPAVLYTGGYSPAKGKGTIATTNSASAVVTSASSVTYKMPAYACIPAHSSKEFASPYVLIPEAHMACESYQMNFPATQSPKTSFTEESSPLKFENRLAFSYSPDGENITQIADVFYVSSLTNYKESQILYEKEMMQCDGTRASSSSYRTKTTCWDEDIVNTRSFYVTYNKKSVTPIYTEPKTKKKNAKEEREANGEYNWQW